MKDIVFDFGGVLVDWNPRYLYRKIFSTDEEMEWFLAHVCTGAWNARQDAGRPFAQAVAELQEKYPDYAAQIADYYARWDEMLGGEIKGTHALVDELKAKGYKLYGLTNWSAESFPLAWQRYPVLQQMDGIVVSGEEKLIKPDPEIYKRLLERFALRAENCIFTDDNAANCAAAQALGFDAIVFENAEQLRAQLQQRGVL